MSESEKRIIALLTDFGPLGQHYVASMKGVILNINPNVSIIDISHNIPSYSIIEGSYILKSAYIHFPQHTVFIVVIDPGVGSSREIIAFKYNSNYYFIGPNNGIFYLFSKEEISECVIVNNEEYFNKPVSNTFHGRDIMAPIGAHISCGTPLSEFGPTFNLDNLTKISVEYKLIPEERIIHCTIQYIDSFGNLTTNIPINDNIIEGSSLSLKDTLELEYKNKKYKGKFVSHFSSESLHSLLFLVGSNGYLEISKNQGNAAKDLSLKIGDIITIRI